MSYRPWIHLYIRDPYAGRNPVDDFMHLAHYWAGAVIPKDVEDSVRKLLEIANDNKVSFQNLIVYALGNATAPEKDLDTFPKELQVALLTKDPARIKEVLENASARQTPPAEVIARLVQINRFDEQALKSGKEAQPDPPADVRHALYQMANRMLQAGDADTGLLIADTLLEKGLPSGVSSAVVLSLKGRACCSSIDGTKPSGCCCSRSRCSRPMHIRSPPLAMNGPNVTLISAGLLSYLSEHIAKTGKILSSATASDGITSSLA